LGHKSSKGTNRRHYRREQEGHPNPSSSFKTPSSTEEPNVCRRLPAVRSSVRLCSSILCSLSPFPLMETNMKRARRGGNCCRLLFGKRVTQSDAPFHSLSRDPSSHDPKSFSRLASIRIRLGKSTSLRRAAHRTPSPSSSATTCEPLNPPRRVALAKRADSRYLTSRTTELTVLYTQRPTFPSFPRFQPLSPKRRSFGPGW
jgi:hypothetical protein